MSVLGPRAQSRSTTLLVVAAVHGLMLWGIWQMRTPVAKVSETFASVMFFVPEAALRHPSSATAPRALSAGHARQSLPSPQPPPPATPSARIDWSAQLEGAARSELDEEENAGRQLAALTRKYVVAADPRNPGPNPASTFRWYEAGIHRIDTRGPLPVLLLNDHCAMLMFIIPFCRIGHIEIHGDLFDGAAKAHGDRLATAGPNEVP